jgi:hypothetical protein
MKSKQTTNPSKFAKPYITGAANGLQSAVQGNEANVAGLQTGLQGALGQLGGTLGNSPLTTAAQGYSTDVLGGKYLGANPYIDGMIGEAREGAFGDAASRFGRGGMAGGTGFAQSLGRGFGQAELGLRYGDYNAERGRMDQAAAGAGNLQNSDLARYGVFAGLTDQAAQLPLLNSRTLASGLGGLLGNYNKTTSSPSIGQMLIQGASNAASAYAGGG